MNRAAVPIAAIDIGSNSIKVTVARAGPDGTLDEVWSCVETVRLGAGVEATGYLADERIEAAMQTLSRFTVRAHDLGAIRIIGVATEATRVASNGSAFLERVRRELGIAVTPITGDEEAALTFRGLASVMDLGGGVVVIDVGGGSTEVVVAEDGVVQSARSLRLGSGGLTERIVRSDPAKAEEIEACRKVAAESLRPLVLPVGPSVRLIAVGGTGEFLARLVADGAPITAAGIGIVLNGLTRRHASDVATELGIAKARARVLPAGIAIIQAAVERVKPDRIEVARSGMRTGLLLAAFAEEVEGGERGGF